MLTQLTIEVLGEKQYSRALDLYGQAFEDLSDPLDDSVEIVRDAVAEQFRSEGSHGGGAKWTKLNDNYERWKDARTVTKEPILVFTGRMRAAFLEEGDPNAYKDVGPRRAVYGVTGDVELRAAAHQKGKGNVPARPIIQLSNLDRRRIDRAFATWADYKRRSVGL